MKSFFKLVFIFLIMSMIFCVQPSDFQIKEITTQPSIQAIANENLELISNNFYNGEVYANQENNDQNSLGSSPIATTVIIKNNLILDNIARTKSSFIHNLSTNNQKVQQIRAP